MSPMIVMRTTLGIGKVSRKWNSCEARNSLVDITDNSEVRFGKTKWLKNGDLSECKRNSRFTVLLKREYEGGVTTSGPSG